MKGKIIFLWIAVPLITFLGGMMVTSNIGSLQTEPGDKAGIEKGEDSRVDHGISLAEHLSLAFESAADKVSPSVVPISAEQVVQMTSPFGLPGDSFRQFFGDDFFKRFFGAPQGGGDMKQTVRSLGSGVIVTEDGYILTNNHVVENSDKLIVELTEGKKYAAKIIGTDPQTDVAVVKIDARNLPAADLGNSEEVRVGQWVIAVGNPFQLLHSVTAGIISARGRSSVGLADYEDFIQTDASINPGNSGGALADLNGRVIGINTAISSPSGGSVGIGFAIPMNMAKKVMDELISKGRVVRGYLALIPQDIDENLAKGLNLENTEGALVGDVTAGGPADKAGIMRGDVIVEFNGEPVKNSLDLRNMVARASPGTRAEVRLYREGKEKVLDVTLGERPKERGGEIEQEAQPTQMNLRKLGLSLQNLTPDLATQMGFKNERGVLVAGVESGSTAEEAGLRPGDLIKEVNKKDVQNVGDFDREIGRLKSGDSAALFLRRGENTFYVAVSIP